MNQINKYLKKKQKSFSFFSSFSNSNLNLSQNNKDDNKNQIIPSEVNYPGFEFKVENLIRKDKQRIGVIKTPHGEIQTPSFIFCATKAAMKGVTSEVMRQENTQIILSNTYHLLLAPGPDIIQKMGGLQKFTGWNGPMLTDSGGYQIFSMGHGSVSDEIKGKKKTVDGWNKTLLKVTEEGATFKSYIDGSIHHLTPELSINIQRKLGADLIVVLDECTAFHVDKKYTEDSMRRSHRWATRSLQEFIQTQDQFVDKPQALYGIIQGGVYEDLRKESVEFINSLPVFGIAIGGSLGSNRVMMKEIIEFTCKHIRSDRPIHLLGIGGIGDIFHGVRQGIDTFDCVHPSRLGRHGGALVKADYWESDIVNIDKLIEEKKKEVDEFIESIPDIYKSKKERKCLNNKDEIPSHIIHENKKKYSNRQKKLQEELKILKSRKNRTIRPHISLLNNAFQTDSRPISSDCTCQTCKKYSRSYLHHLFKSDEMLGPILTTIHNVHYMNEMMKDIRIGIKEDRLDEIEKKYIHPDLK